MLKGYRRGIRCLVVRTLTFLSLLTLFTPNLNCSTIQLPLNERVMVASTIYALIREHADVIISDEKLEDLYRSYVERFVATSDRRSFDLATMAFVAQLNSGHTFFWDSWLSTDSGQSLGFYALPFGGKWVVQRSSTNTLRAGDIITRLNNASIESIFEERKQYISASSEAARQRALFLRPYLFPRQFTVTLENGHTVLLNRASLPEIEHRMQGHWVDAGRIAYISLPSFLNPALEQRALEYVAEFRRAQVIIIDLRGNIGGVLPVNLLRRLMSQRYRGWKETVRIGRSAIEPPEEARPIKKAQSDAPFTSLTASD
jgi:carboxyl-terminal processing protease